MAAPYSIMIGFQVSGVFSKGPEKEKVKDVLTEIIKHLYEQDESFHLWSGDNPSEGEPETFEHCISDELEHRKGSMYVIAGVFNYANEEFLKDFCQSISYVFDTTTYLVIEDHSDLSGTPKFHYFTSYGDSNDLTPKVLNMIKRMW